jgi:hypothetical protein
MNAKILVTIFFLAGACKDNAAQSDAASATSASASASASTSQAPLDTHGKWWAVAQKSRVYTDDRRTDADNAIRLVPSPNREIIVRALGDMATEPATGEGLRAASEIARTAQDRVDDTHNPAAKIAIATAGLIVLHGLVAQACVDHATDMTVLTPLMAAVREMPLPHLEKSDGRTERNILEQEMRTALDDKTMKALLANAPGPKKSL